MRLIDRYLLIELSKRLLVTLAIVLGSLVLERLLRLFDLVSMKGGPFYMVWEMALMLVPHYLGLALPAGFFVSIFLVAASCSANNEFDVLLSGGVSPLRFAMPFVASALALTAVSIGLFGYLQPYSRYSYRAVHYLVDSVPWDVRVPERIFATVQGHITVSADHVKDTELSGIFVHMTDNDRDVVITARRGKLIFDAQKTNYLLRLIDGTQVVTGKGGEVSSIGFDHLLVQKSLITSVPPFRQRGGDVRELSFGELAREGRAPRGDITRAEVAGELHARLIRSLSLIFMPFMGIPLALTAKRRQRGAGMVFGGFVLVMYHYILQTLEGLAETGSQSVAGMWIAMAVFAVLSMVMFWRTQRHPGENFLDPPLAALAGGMSWLGALPRRLARRRT
jgi:lipopolysaccharide export system permease protein